MKSPSRRTYTMRARAEAVEATRDRIARAAMARFLAQLYDDVTIAAIAADAGVSERTFFRYFPTKEAVLFGDFASRLDWFRAALEVRPDSEPLLDSVRIAVQSYPDDREVVRQVAQLRATLLPESSIADNLNRIQGQFASAIEDRARRLLGDGRDERLQAAVLGGAIAGALLAMLRVFGDRGEQDTTVMFGMVADAIDVLRNPPVVATGKRAPKPRAGDRR
jgi:AcrR family transcriptional regulator